MGAFQDEQWVAPPSWPQPPPGWTPPTGWTPDPAWGPAPYGWSFWRPDRVAREPFPVATPPAEGTPRVKRWLGAGVAAIVLLGVAAVADDSAQDDTTDQVAVEQTVASPSAEPSTVAPPPSIAPSPSAEASPRPSSTPRPTAVPTVPPTTDELIAGAKQTDGGTALVLLGSLRVKGRAPRTGYDRDLFGSAWTDTDRNGCDTRNDVLARDLTGETFKPGTRGCVVLTGVLLDPYTGRKIAFTKQDGMAVQIDHVVALSDAWQKGAQQWPAGKRLAFANDPLNLLAVDGPTNGSKSDGDAATWLPPNKRYRCSMVARQIAVKAKYRLWVTAAERDAAARLLNGCPRLKAPAGNAPTIAPVAPPKPVTRRAAPAERPAGGGSVDPDYGTCKTAKANGKGPYSAGEDPEYDYYRDSDNDGVVCE